MKTKLLLAAILLLLATNVVSFMRATKYYNVACRMSDLIRCYDDHLNNDSIIDIEDYGCFEELEGIFLWDDAVGEPIDLEDYVYCY